MPFGIDIEDIELENGYLWFNYTICSDEKPVIKSRYCCNTDVSHPKMIVREIEHASIEILKNIDAELEKPFWKETSGRMQECIEGIIQSESNMYFIEKEDWSKQAVTEFIHECHLLGIPDDCYEVSDDGDPLLTIYGAFSTCFDLSEDESELKLSLLDEIKNKESMEL